MALLLRKACNSRRLSALIPCEAAQGNCVSLEISGNDPIVRERLADRVEQIAATRSRSAFSDLFEHFAPRIKSYLVRLGSDASSAEEIMQEVMLNVWRKAEQYDRRQASVSTWIFRIARNRRIDSLRRTNKPELDAKDPMLQPAEIEQPDITINRAQMEVKVRQVIETLPEEQLVLLKAAFYDGFSHSEIAKNFGLPLGTVKSRIRLAFIRLRGSLEPDH